MAKGLVAKMTKGFVASKAAKASRKKAPVGSFALAA